MRHELLLQIGERVRHRREGLGYTQKQLAERAGLSLRFLAQLERGEGNISLLRFADVAVALGLPPAELFGGVATATAALEARRGPVVALLGVRGAGKSTVGGLLAARLAVPFVELDERIEQAAGLALSEISSSMARPTTAGSSARPCAPSSPSCRPPAPSSPPVARS